MRQDLEGLGRRIGETLRSACHPEVGSAGSVGMVVAGRPGCVVAPPTVWERPVHMAVDGVRPETTAAVDELVTELFAEEGSSLVRLASLFVDDRNAAEDLVQEAFIRLARNVQRIEDRTRAPAYLRSIVLNLARDHNRRGLVSLRHHLPFDGVRASTEDEIVLSAERQRILEVLRGLPLRQRSCLVLRYYEELGIDDIAEVLGISRNSVKTHLSRGLAAMEARL